MLKSSPLALQCNPAVSPVLPDILAAVKKQPCSKWAAPTVAENNGYRDIFSGFLSLRLSLRVQISRRDAYAVARAREPDFGEGSRNASHRFGA